jgi:hypothetical protein
VQQPLTQALGLGQRELAVEHERPEPGEHVLGEQHQLEPDLVRGEGLEGQPPKSQLGGLLHAILDAGVQAVAQLELAATARASRALLEASPAAAPSRSGQARQRPRPLSIRDALISPPLARSVRDRQSRRRPPPLLSARRSGGRRRRGLSSAGRSRSSTSKRRVGCCVSPRAPS